MPGNQIIKLKFTSLKLHTTDFLEVREGLSDQDNFITTVTDKHSGEFSIEHNQRKVKGCFDCCQVQFTHCPMRCSLCSKVTIGAKTRDFQLCLPVNKQSVDRKTLFNHRTSISDLQDWIKLVTIEEVTSLAGNKLGMNEGST